MHHLMGLVPPDQSALSLGRPSLRSAGVARIAKSNRAATSPRVGRSAWTAGPRLARLGSRAREAHRVLGTNLGPTGGQGFSNMHHLLGLVPPALIGKKTSANEFDREGVTLRANCLGI